MKPLILEAIPNEASLVEQKASLLDEAEDRYARIIASRETIPWQELRRYLIAHIAGVTLPLPTPRKLMR
ncbi:MAG: hypothetical protein RBS46_10300 [Methyloversatilis sp.]|jgi:hypothetical protein|nr:hypothetical protein [Methyloversatilis sp.]